MEYNGLNNFSISPDRIILYITSSDKFSVNHLEILFNINCWLGVVEYVLGKLKPLPVKPKFDFIKYVNYETTDKQWGKLYNLAIAIIEDKTQDIVRDEHNAKIAVQIAKLAGQIK